MNVEESMTRHVLDRVNQNKKKEVDRKVRSVLDSWTGILLLSTSFYASGWHLIYGSSMKLRNYCHKMLYDVTHPTS